MSLLRNARRNGGTLIRVGVLGALLATPLAAALPAAATSTTPQLVLPVMQASLPGAAVFARPATGSFLVDGRALGHGIGMSQEGAVGAARIGVNATAILAHYYPHTAVAAAPSRSLKVWLQEAGRQLTVTATPGLRLSIARTPATVLLLPVGPVAWRMTATSATTVAISQLATRTGTWKAWTPPGQPSAALAVGSSFLPGVAATANIWIYRGATGVRVENIDGSTSTEPGAVSVVRESTGWPVVVVTVDLDMYVRSVVAQEIGPSSPPAAQRAQAIAARTYAVRASIDNARAGRPFGICDTTNCQSYPGIASGTVAAGTLADRANLYAGSDAATTATAGAILTYLGVPINAMFGAADGGYTRSGGTAYLPAQPDSWDALTNSSSHAWTAVLPLSVVEGAWPGLGKLTRLQVVGRNGQGDLGGRAANVVLDFCTATVCTQVTTTPGAIGSRYDWPSYWNGLRSSWWLPRTQIMGSVSLAHVVKAAHTDPGFPSGPSAFPAETMLVQRGLVAGGLLVGWSVDGSYGPLTTRAYAAWQLKNGLTGAAVTGIPDLKTLTLLGQKYLFAVTA